MLNDSLLIIGAGGHGRVVADAALEMNPELRIGFLDDGEGVSRIPTGHPVVGQVAAMAGLVRDWKSAIVAIGNAAVRIALTEQLRRCGFVLSSVVHPRASVSRNAVIGEGVCILANAVVNTGARIGDACIVNSGAIVEHDCVLESGVHVCPGAALAGAVRVGARSWIGIGACVRQGLTLGADVTVGAGASVVRNIDAGETVAGVPARPLRQASRSL
jgi:sugar O-acyltransferase (sialic acid O-acetyltransferase NeuD family)